MAGDPLPILVVDDDAAIRLLLRTVFKRRNLNVDCANDGEEGLARLARAAYSVVVLDLMMPKFNGFEFVEQLFKTNPDLCRRVIVLTAVSRSKLTELDDRKIWGVIRKPFDIDELVRCVEDCAAQQAVAH